MVLDTETLRVAFVVVATSMLVLFSTVTWRLTRSLYCLWWCVALALFVVGSAGYLLNGTEAQRWANPSGNALVVAGAACVWAGARSLRGLSTRRPQLLAVPAVVLVVSLLDDPATDRWAGGPVFLAAMSGMVGLASFELFRKEHGNSRDAGCESTYEPILRSMAVVSGVVSLYYLGRWAAFLAVGPDGHAFTTYFGSEATTLISTVLLATVSFSMSSLSNEQQIDSLRERATRDSLTGLLNRSEFMRLAVERTASGRTPGTGAVVLADLDHFKELNDTYGHPTGDATIRAFADACTQTVRSDDLIGRYGGEEFVVLLPGVSTQGAEDVVRRISERFKTRVAGDGLPAVSASYGIAAAVAGGVDEAIARADAALYRAKQRGRDRAVTSTDP